MKRRKMKKLKKLKKIMLILSPVLVVAILVAGNHFWGKKMVETTAEAHTTLEKKGYEKDQFKTSLPKEPSNHVEESKKGVSSQENTSSKTNTSPSSTSHSGVTSSETSSEEGNVEGDNLESSTNLTDKKSSNGKNSKDTGSNSDKEDDTVSLDEIKDYYQNLFSELEAQETSKVDQLIVEAKADFISKSMSKSDLIVKYQETATVMEKNADHLFNIIYKNLQYDLERNGHNLNEAQEFKQTYDAKKEERLVRVIKQVSNF